MNTLFSDLSYKDFSTYRNIYEIPLVTWLVKSNWPKVIHHRDLIINLFENIDSKDRPKLKRMLESQKNKDHVAGVYELFFYNFLQKLNKKFEYEKVESNKTPDFMTDDGIIIEVTALLDDVLQNNSEIVFSPDDEIRKIENKANLKRKKYSSIVANRPFMVVLGSDNGVYQFDPIIKQAIYGKQEIKYPQESLLVESIVRDNNDGFFSGWKGEAEKEKKNTSVSAIAICTRYYEGCEIKIFHNPYALNPLPIDFFEGCPQFAEISRTGNKLYYDWI